MSYRPCGHRSCAISHTGHGERHRTATKIATPRVYKYQVVRRTRCGARLETCGPHTCDVADLIVMAHAFAELRDGVVARQHEERFQRWAQFRSNPLWASMAGRA
eukprot:scaffold109090_cov39-Phaeocystis_antarctica.AAC.2